MDEDYGSGGVGVAGVVGVDGQEGVDVHPGDDKNGAKDQGGRANSEEYGAGEGDYGDDGYDDEYRQGGFPADFRCAPPLFEHPSTTPSSSYTFETFP